MLALYTNCSCPSHRRPLRYQQVKGQEVGRQQRGNPKKMILSLKELSKEKGARPECLKGLYDVELEVQALAERCQKSQQRCLRQRLQQQKVTKAVTTQKFQKSAGSQRNPSSAKHRPGSAPKRLPPTARHQRPPQECP